MNHKRHIYITGSEGKDKDYTRRAALKLILDYYNKHYAISGSVGEDWKRHLTQLNSLYDEYNIDVKTRA